jgi:hypothetical protein
MVFAVRAFISPRPTKTRTGDFVLAGMTVVWQQRPSKPIADNSALVYPRPAGNAPDDATPITRASILAGSVVTEENEVRIAPLYVS